MKKFSFLLQELVITNKRHTLHVENISFSIGQSSNTVALIGESGMGKTTIFKSLFPRYIENWSLEPGFRFAANHSYDNVPFTNQDIRQNKLPTSIGFASQSPFFLEDYTASDNIFYPLDWTKRGNFSADEKNCYLDKWKISKLADKPLSILSGGQRQLVNLARALVINPKIVIIDECFSSMNESMAKQYISFLKEDYPDTYFIVTSHRKTDIRTFDCAILNLKRVDTKRGHSAVTAKREVHA